MKKPYIILSIVAALVLAGGGFYLGSHKSKVESGDTAATSSTRSPDLQRLLNNLQKQFPTIKKSYVYSEQRDPNNNLGKAGYYVAGAEFYDSRTNTLPDGEAFGTDSGGAIEVYANSQDASRRVEYLKQFQGGALDPGAFKRVGSIVIRASPNYTKSQQQEVINYLTSQVD